MILPFFSTYFAKPTINHCKNRLLTWIYSVFLALPMAVTQLNTRRQSTLRYILEFLQKIEDLDMFPSKRQISGSNGRTGDNLSKRESPVQNGRVGTYAFLFGLKISAVLSMDCEFQYHNSLFFRITKSISKICEVLKKC